MIDEAEPVLQQDPVMARLIETHDPYVEAEWDEFERLCISIINQQLSTASANAVRERVFELFGGEVTPEAVLETADEPLRSAGLSRSKIEYIRNAARAFQEQDLTRDGLAEYSNDEVVDTLTEIKGVGDWTARMFLVFVLEREDVLPLGDLAVRRGIEQLYGDGHETGEMTRAEMREIAESWRPYRSVATRYIWAEYESD
ncbi:DNA-3-methyladenine glycosylase family protein [Natrinema ejinorense]|uniref:3-methyladenine DNA glycosylase n=1 Tax=Natrinema ejinorense TaxID=373386 RepID=A0A2A5QRY1_9EURY|nr:DNA-3-methyladenine glycosylase [Natrinema ejinorense]PCR89597.1 3-methyladenine DNA glycosylase [Natrinema ejinorense]